MALDKAYIYGRHALTEALLNAPQVIEKIFLDSSFHDQDLKELIRKKGIQIESLDSHTMQRRLREQVQDFGGHQGVLAIIDSSKLMKPYKLFIEELIVNENTSLVLLNELQDPQNVGAIIRSAAAFGVSGILIGEHNQAPVTGTVVKVSAGMAFRVPLISIGNINTTIRDLKKHGFWVYGLAEDAKQLIGKEDFNAPTLFVIGNESRGINEKTREECDVLLQIPMHPKCESLNAATSASLAFYAWSAHHPHALKQG